jgi:hypothetical protein
MATAPASASIAMLRKPFNMVTIYFRDARLL